MSVAAPTALIADDEPLLRDALCRQLKAAWPELGIVAQVRNGREAVSRFEALQPDVCFLDVHMPGISGVEAARRIGRRARLVFVTAYSEYAIEAFERGAVDYLVKPVEAARLAATVARLKEQLRMAEPPADHDALLEHLLARLAGTVEPTRLRWLRASVGASVRLIPVDDIDYLRSDQKYTCIACRGEAGQPDALVRTPLKELLSQLDPAQFAQVHRSVVVNLGAVRHVVRSDNDTAQLHLKDRPEILPVSRAYLHLFRQM